MRNSIKIVISLLSIAVVPFISGCGSSTEKVKEVSSTTYVPAPAPPQEIVVQPAPVVVARPAPVVISPPTTVTTTEEKRSSDSADMGNNATEESSSAYHSETSTVTPMTTIPAVPEQTQTTTYQKKTYQETN